MRSFVGAVLLTVLVVIYPLIVMGFAAMPMAGATKTTQLVFYVVAGLAWVLPAGLIISWMARGRRKQA
ncbi:DUF2842 domain-containing protein [Methylobrevis albus]|nr:DUF2842 domain-containing protein [Methylobrevis albus]